MNARRRERKIDRQIERERERERKRERERERDEQGEGELSKKFKHVLYLLLFHDINNCNW